MLVARIALAALAALAAAPAAAPAADGFTKRPVAFQVVTGPEDDTTCRIVGDLYTPDGVSRSAPAPAILATNGFGGSKDEFATLAPSYARRGYVFLAYSGLGFGGSGCKITLDDPDWDGKAGSQLVSFLAGTKAAEDGTTIDYVVRDGAGDPRVGMIGGSYGGQIQFAVAGIDPRLDAIVPQITWNDLAYSLAPNDTDLVRGVTSATPGVVKLDWPVLFTGSGIGTGLQHTIRNGDPSHLGACPNFADQVCPGLITAGALGHPTPETTAFLRHASVASYVDRVRVPTLLSQGLSDTLFNVNEAVATYEALRAQGTPVKMLWRSAGHSGGGLGRRESDPANPEAAYESRMALEWLDFWLRGIGDAPRLDFSFLRDWALPASGDAAPAVGTTRTYPAGRERSLRLSADGTLAGSPRDVRPGSVTFAAVTGSPTGSGNGYTTTPAPDAPGTTATFTGPPLPEATDVVGVPRVTVQLSAPVHAASQGAAPGGKLVLFAKLLDVAPDGSAKLPRNLLAAARVADVGKPVTIALPGIAHRFAEGHRLRLVLTTSNSTNRTNSVGGPVSVVIDPASPSTLQVPVLGAQAGPAGSAPGGLTPFAPAAGGPAQRAELPAGVAARPAASLPSARACRSRRSFRVRLRQAPRGDRVTVAEVVVNGRRVERLRGRALRRARVDLRGLPRGTYRVVVTSRTAKGRTLRSARTYRTCVARRR